jgi:hypothetical protein
MALTDQKDAAAEGMMEKLVQVNRVAKNGKRWKDFWLYCAHCGW